MAEEVKPAGGDVPDPQPDDARVALETRVKGLEGELGEVRGKAQKYSKEAGDRRVENDGLKTRIAELEKELAGGKSKETPTSPDGETAKLRTELGELRSELESRKQRDTERDQADARLKHRNAIQALVARNKIDAADDATELLAGRTKLAADGKTLTFTARDKDTGQDVELAVTDENFEKAGLLPAIFWPAQGASGGGGKPPAPVSDAGSVDMAKIGDRTYWNKNKEKVIRQGKEAARS